MHKFSHLKNKWKQVKENALEQCDELVENAGFQSI